MPPTLAIAAGRACHGANVVNPESAAALNKLSLRFSELALELLWGEVEKGAGDEAASV